MEKQTGKPNHLICEQSPYLLQHAYQPVNWYPWGDEAFRVAKAEDKPILLSCGYSSCHWCHVMARESFEDEAIAGLVNENFVNIKVDREERPDVDAIYQTVCQLLTGHGGWPLTVFLTPDLKPFYAGTYFPPTDRYGRTGFPSLLKRISRLYCQERERVEEIAQKVLNAVRDEMAVQEMLEVDAELVDEWSRIPMDAVDYLKHYYDNRHGGFGGAPKFPTVNLLKLFLEVGAKHNPSLVEMILETLKHMARGGIFDQLGGGFHRYSTDARWLIPHFEKMLYDNALLVPLYLSAYQITGEVFYARIAEETLGWVKREMTSPDGGFYSALDADSEGEEGKFYVWTEEEVKEVLGDLASVVCAYFGVTTTGNFENGTSVLHVAKSFKEMAAKLGFSEEEVEGLIESAKAKLLAEREKRTRPFRDEKIITAWNGMMISAFAQAARILQRPEYGEIARTALDFILTKVVFSDGTLRRSYKDTGSEVPGFLEDYAYMINGVLDVYEIDFEHSYLRKALDLADAMLEKFWDGKGVFYDTMKEHNGLVIRPRSGLDQSFPSGVSQALLALLRLSTFDTQYSAVVANVLAAFSDAMVHNPWGYAALISVLDWYNSGTVEVMFVGNPDDATFQKLRSVADQTYFPRAVLYGLTPGWEDVWKHSKRNLPEEWKVRSEASEEQPVCYVCQNFRCSPPVADPEQLRKTLSAAMSPELRSLHF